MMQSIYTISFCLLRFDEVLNIQHHISILNLFSSLPSRKRHSRYVYHWSKLESGYNFRKIRLNYQVSEADKLLVSFSKSPAESDAFPKEPTPPAGEAASVEGWPIGKLCDWGGWPTR